MPPARPHAFPTRIVRWQRSNGRHGLPWQGTRDAYRIWLSEVMLQQTQVATVLPFYERFVARFPTVASLAAADIDEVLALWSGLGYYARGRNLHAASRKVMEQFGGVFPSRFDDLVALPGIGRSTAGAIAAFAGGERRAILDGNVRRVLARHAGIPGDPASAATLCALWKEAQARLPRRGIEAYTQGMMDLGAEICSIRKPACLLCPVSADCVALREDRIDELPAKRARKAAVHRKIAMLVVLSRGEVLLEKRAPTGIWGGLWSLPEVQPNADPAAALREGYGIEAASVEAMEPFQHAFTHFTLEVSPWRIQARRAPAIAAEKRATWLALDDLAGCALPSPVRKLLARA